MRACHCFRGETSQASAKKVLALFLWLFSSFWADVLTRGWRSVFALCLLVSLAELGLLVLEREFRGSRGSKWDQTLFVCVCMCLRFSFSFHCVYILQRLQEKDLKEKRQIFFMAMQISLKTINQNWFFYLLWIWQYTTSKVQTFESKCFKRVSFAQQSCIYLIIYSETV